MGMNAALGQQKIGEQRFASGIEYEKQLLRLTRVIQDRLLSGLPSNYSRDRNTNLAEFFRSAAKEFARLQLSSSRVNEDKYHSETQTEYLWQILGDTLFLGEHAITENIDDVAYREFLIRVRNAYYGGSRPANIEAAVSDIIGLPVTLKELYLEARKEGSSYGLKDTHRMFFDILMDGVDPSSSIGLILEDLKFFIDILKPAHVQYDTRLIWTDTARFREQACTPSYNFAGCTGIAYGADRIHMVTWRATSVYGSSGADPSTDFQTGTIQSVDLTRKILNMTDERLVVYTSETEFFTGTSSVEISPSALSPGDMVTYYANKDSVSTSSVIGADWGYTGVVSSVDESLEVVGLDSGASISYGDDLLVYTRDGAGEYRITVADLLLGKEIAFRGTEYDAKCFQFYNTPPQVLLNPSKQYAPEVVARPFFQENVIKNLEYPPGMTGGSNIAVVDGVVTVLEYDPRFYYRDGDKQYRERKVDRYSLSVNGTYAAQFTVNDPVRTLTKAESKAAFVSLGYTGINDPTVNYSVTVTHTGNLVEDNVSPDLVAVGADTRMCEKLSTCQMVPFYEDLRKYWPWPDLQLTSGFFTVMADFPDVPGVTGTQDIPAWFQVSSDPDVYRMPVLPMLGQEGQPAEVSDVTVYVNGLRVDNAISYIDPWSGIIGLNFIPPFDVTLRVDYWHSSRYPSPQSHLVEVPSLTGLTGIDTPAKMTVISTAGVVTRLSWPCEVADSALYGDDRDYQVNKYPILNERGELAGTTDITVSVGVPIVSGTTQILGYVDDGTVLDSMGVDWSLVVAGDLIIMEAENYLDRTLIYTVQSVDSGTGTLVIPGILPSLSPSYPYRIIRFTEVEEAVTAVRPLLGHVRVNFIAPAGVVLKFDYYYTSERREYLMVPDMSGDTGADGYGASQYTADTYYGSRYGYGLVVDYAFTGPEIPRRPFDDLLKYGYRYRSFDLTSSSVLNSDTLLLNGYTVPSERGSFKGSGGNLNEARTAFSPEYLTDTGKTVVLNDKYLHNNLDPYTKLNPGVPLFVQSQTDDGHYRLANHASEHVSYDPSIEGAKDLQGSFTVIDPDSSGIINRNAVCDIGTTGRITLHSNLKVVCSDNGGYDAPLSPITDAGSSLPFKTVMVERYYPNREQRVNDYLDYVNQVPSEYREGTLSFMHNSRVAKCANTNLLGMRRGDTLLVRDVPFERFDQGTQQYVTVLDELEYVVIEVVDTQTVYLNRPFQGPKGQYEYTLTRSLVYAVDVRLNEVARTLFVSPTGFDYGLTGIGVTGAYFRDPDPDPYPRSPDNPNLPHPSAYYYPIGDVTIDGELCRTNRILGVTGNTVTSNIVDANGYVAGSTGYYDSGYTGPVGALNLGITGPVEYANPRTTDEYDTYRVPGGDTGNFFSYSEAEYRVQWRNWDQGLIIANMGVTGGGYTGMLAGLTGVVVIPI